MDVKIKLSSTKWMDANYYMCKLKEMGYNSKSPTFTRNSPRRHGYCEKSLIVMC